MFNKEINKETKKIIISGKLYKDNDLLVTDSLAEMLSEYHSNKALQEEMDYQDNITSYINRKHENEIRKQYNPKVVNLYENGLLIINNEEYKLQDFFIVFNDKENNFHIKCVDQRFNNPELDYNKAVKFIDTTAFINLINSSEINDNKIIINDVDTLNNIASNWDGYLHGETKETDAILNKKMINGDAHE